MITKAFIPSQPTKNVMFSAAKKMVCCMCLEKMNFLFTMNQNRKTFCCFIEICYFTLTGAVTLIRMTLLSNAAVYRNNVLMNANLVYLAFVLLILGLFNAIFVGGFFQTAYKFAKPFVKFIIAAFAVVGLGETLFHIPGLDALNAFGFAHMGLQLGILALGILLFSGLTVLSKHRAMRNFERIDL